MKKLLNLVKNNIGFILFYLILILGLVIISIRFN